MKVVIDIPESILNTIQADEMISREQLAVLQMHILNGTPLTELIEDIKTEIEQVMLTDMGIDGEEHFDKGCRTCLSIIDRHISEVGTSKSLPEGSKE